LFDAYPSAVVFYFVACVAARSFKLQQHDDVVMLRMQIGVP
jgi:hypothetical protein